jgi:hypothetical protein
MRAKEEDTNSIYDYLTSSVVGLSSSALIQPILTFVGFKSTGIVAGSLGTKIMSLYGGKIASGSFVSLCQSAGVFGVSMSTTAIFSVPVALSTYGVIRIYKYYNTKIDE